jgi:hypothetical protein
MPEEWKLIDQKVQAAFEDGSVLRADRVTLDRWLVALTGRSHTYEKDQLPMQRRLEVLRHLTSVRLAEESQERRDQQEASAAAEIRRHNRTTRWIAVAGIIIAALSAVLNYLKPSPALDRAAIPSPPPSPIAAPSQSPVAP